MSPEPIIEISNVSKSFLLPHLQSKTLKNSFINAFKNSDKASRQEALKDISFTVNKGDFFGIVGRNGSGKSTLLKILAGIYQPTSGSVVVRGTLMPFIELGVGFNPELTGRENVYLNGAILGKPKKEIDRDYKEIVEFAELEEHMDKKLKNYSSGMQVRLAFACATKTNTDILVVDEILAVGDADFQKKCFKYFKELKQSNKTVILVTHDMGSVRDYCNKAILIENGYITEEGSVDEVASAYSKLFSAIDGNSKVVDRIGDNRIRIDKTKTKKSYSYQDIVELTFIATVNSEINPGEDLIFAYALKTDDGIRLSGNKIEYTVERKLNRGESIIFTFKFNNYFRRGKYNLDVSIFSKTNNSYLDCWIDCAQFVSDEIGTEGYPIFLNDAKEISLDQ